MPSHSMLQPMLAASDSSGTMSSLAELIESWDGSSAYILEDGDITHTSDPGAYVLKIRDMESRDRPRERLLHSGPADLTMQELVALLLGVGTKREEVMTMAHRIIKEYGERAILAETNPRRLADSLDIPLAKACQLIASIEIGRRYGGIRAGKPLYVRTARQAFEHFRYMGELQKEQLRALYVGSRYQVVHEEVVSIGSMTANIVHPREIFQPAIQYGAVAVLIAHNHPSGSLEPTAADLNVTAQLIEGGKLLGIELLDHLVIAGDTYLSMMEVDPQRSS